MIGNQFSLPYTKLPVMTQLYTESSHMQNCAMWKWRTALEVNVDQNKSSILNIISNYNRRKVWWYNYKKSVVVSWNIVNCIINTSPFCSENKMNAVDITIILGK